MAEIDSLVGECLCVGAKFTLNTLHPVQTLICHCGMCRRSIGSPGVPFGSFPRKDMKFITEETLTKFRSSTIADRYFCNRCGCSINMSYDCEEYTVWINLGVLTNYNPDKLDQTKAGHIHVKNKLNWEVISDGIPQFQEAESWIMDACKPK